MTQLTVLALSLGTCYSFFAESKVNILAIQIKASHGWIYIWLETYIFYVWMCILVSTALIFSLVGYLGMIDLTTKF